MPQEDIRRHSRWLMRAMEWNDPRARYPNVWRHGMPRHVLAYDSVASRLRLGDLIGVYYPASQRYAERAERFVGVARIVGLSRAEEPGHAWIDLETAHRFDPPLDLGEAPRRVFLCCDPGWPHKEVALFQKLLDAAIASGFKPLPEDLAAEPRPGERAEEERAGAVSDVEDARARPEDAREGASTPEPVRPAEPPPAAAPRGAPARPRREVPTGRLFGGVDFSGDMRDPRQATWLALVELHEERLRVVRLDPTGRSGLQTMLRDGDSEMLRVEAVGLDFPFGLPIPFAERLLGGSFPDEGWWALARRLERMTRPEYLVALQEFRDVAGELKRYTDEVAGGFSPLHRINPDLGPMTYHGIKLLAEERSRYAIRPFETAKGRLLLEVYPGWLARRMAPPAESGPGERNEALLAALAALASWPVEVVAPFRKACLASRDALDAVIAARAAAAAALTGEAEKPAEEFASGEAGRVRREGWIYGLLE